MQTRSASTHRELILDIVRRTDDHPTADAVFMRARTSLPTISLTTVYRNLRRLVTDGQLRERMFSGVSRFDAHVEEHGHLVCVGCGAIADIPADGSTLPQHFKTAAPAWAVDHVDLELRGRCPACLKQAERAPHHRTPQRRGR
jgi:Fur family transcriptional regulator, peroxide stress response regulator